MNYSNRFIISQLLDTLDIKHKIDNSKITILCNLKINEQFIKKFKNIKLQIQKVTGNVSISQSIHVDNFRMFNFNIVNGNFNCINNNLTSLEGGPQKVGGNFNCSNNKLTSLEGGPQKVGGDFYCNSNNLTSLEGGPQEVG